MMRLKGDICTQSPSRGRRFVHLLQDQGHARCLVNRLTLLAHSKIHGIVLGSSVVEGKDV